MLLRAFVRQAFSLPLVYNRQRPIDDRPKINNAVNNLPHKRRGFTLLEVLVATVIFAIAVAGLMSGLSGSLRNAARLTDYDRAAMLARRKMDELLEDKKLPKFIPIEGRWDPILTGGHESGWRARIQPWEILPSPTAGMMALDRIELQVWWLDGSNRRTFAVEAFRRATLTESDVRGGAVK
jgi:type II secretion system protein I